MRTIFFPFLLCLFSLLETGLYSQVAVNTSGAAPNASSILDISSTSKGLLIPRMTLAEMQAIVNPASGLLVYNTTNQALYNYAGGSWSMVKAKAPSLLVDADGNTSVDAEYAANNDMIYFRLAGNTKMILKNSRLEFIDPNNNLFFGENAGFSTSSGTYNLAIGYEALYTNSTGFRNIAIGYRSLRANTIATDNTAVGYSALGLSTGFDNTAFGSLALSQNTTGNTNTACGWPTLPPPP